MCGILGIVLNPAQPVSNKWVERLTKKLFQLSETRGREASGLAVLAGSAMHVQKYPISGSRLVKTANYKSLLERALANRKGPFALIGHSRLVTDGNQRLDDNNQPLVRDSLAVVHNGIVVNSGTLWQDFPQLKRKAQVDSEIIPALLAHFMAEGKPLLQALQTTYGLIEGETSIAALFQNKNCLLLASNTGSIYTTMLSQQKTLIFASEEYILRQLMDTFFIRSTDLDSIYQVAAGTAILVDLESLSIMRYQLQGDLPSKPPNVSKVLRDIRRFELETTKLEAERASMRRCSRCILPETMPFIQFDEEGVCTYCTRYVPFEHKSPEILEGVLDNYRNKRGDSRPDCIVAFSGGRDSSYGLHLLKTQFGMKPLAYTYDWGMVTELGRRNQSRMCGKLGVEHIWISADIKAKRENIRLNVEAWMRKPDLGIIPLFMAGDKQFFYYANKTMKQTGIPLMIFCTNRLEKTDFKTGFCGIQPHCNTDRFFALRQDAKIKMTGYYLGQFMANPAYLNCSIPDTLFAYLSYYVLKRDFTYLFDYYPWNEDEINDVLLNEYNWELSPDTSTTWRIGDGTAPFYNYIYYTVAGFTEHDTFRSNQIRENIMSREDALRIVAEENRPRWESIREYVRLIDIDFDEFIRVVDKIPKLYAQGLHNCGQSLARAMHHLW